MDGKRFNTMAIDNKHIYIGSKIDPGTFSSLQQVRKQLSLVSIEIPANIIAKEKCVDMAATLQEHNSLVPARSHSHMIIGNDLSYTLYSIMKFAHHCIC